MLFLNYIWLWGPLTAAAVAVPILIHIFSRYRPKPLEWAAMELLRRALVVRSRRLRMEDLILLLLRCAALALIGLALARPAWTPSGSGLHGRGSAGVIIAIDGSFSMQHQPNSQSRFDVAKARAEEILKTLRPGDPVTLVVMGNELDVKLRNADYDAQAVEKVIKGLQPKAEPLNLEMCLQQLGDRVAELKSPSRELHIITDAQASTWQDTSAEAKKAMKRLRSLAAVYFLPTGGDQDKERGEKAASVSNLAITRLALAGGTMRLKSTARYAADVFNAGTEPRTNVTVNLLLDGSIVSTATIATLPAGKTETVDLFADFDRKGTHELVAAIDESKSDLPLDDKRYLIADVRDTVRALCVDGDARARGFGSETGFLQFALDPPSGGSGVTVKTIQPYELMPSLLDEYDVVLLANVSQLSSAQGQALSDFVRRGGGLVFFLGDKVTTTTDTTLVDREGAHLLPAEIGAVTEKWAPGPSEESRSGAWGVSLEMEPHLVTAGLGPKTVGKARFWRYEKVTPRPGARVLVRLNTGDPLLVEQSLEQGKVLLFASTANIRWNEMAKHPGYLMMVQQALTYLTRRTQETPLLVGEEMVFPMQGLGAPNMVTVTDPASEKKQFRVIDHNGRKAAVLGGSERPAKPGVYRLDAENNVTGVRAVNVDGRESAVAVLHDSGLRKAASDLSMRLVNSNTSIASLVQESRGGGELWRWLILIALAALLAEGILAAYFSRKAARASAAPQAVQP